MNLKHFRGTETPLEVSEWLISTEKLLKASQLPEDLWKRAVDFLLEDNAHHWCKAEQRQYGTDLMWEKFCELFNERFFPANVRDVLYDQFLHLKQGSMTVDEYDAEFSRLSHFGKMLIPTELERAKRFHRGLSADIRRFTTS